MKRTLLLAATLALPACGHSAPAATPPDASSRDAGVDTGASFVGRPGDLGANSPIVDPGGLQGTLQQGAITDAWKPATCADSVTIATGVTGAAWGGTTYGAVDKSPHAVHTSWRFATDTSIAAIWETDAATDATFLAYGSSPTRLDHIVQGVAFTNPDVSYGALPYPVRVHEAHVCGLTADQTYYYAVGGDGWYGNVYSVKTAPAAGSTSPFRFAVVGDSNAFYDLFAQVAVKMGSYAPDWTLFTGDLVNSGFSQHEWDQWFAAGDPLIAKVPTMTVHGNHEDMATGYFALWALPGVEQYYSFDYGDVHVVVLNDSPPPGEAITGSPQATFLESDLTAAQARPNPPRWYVTSHHRPMFASDDGEGSNLSVRAAWQPIYEKHHTDLDFNGHNHHFEMTAPVLGDGGISEGGVTYVTSAGGGAAYDDPVPIGAPWSLAYYAGLSFAIVDVNDAKLEVTGYRVDGTVIHAITLAK